MTILKEKDVAEDGFHGKAADSIPIGWKLSNLGAVLEQHRESWAPMQDAIVPYVGLKHIETGNPRLGPVGSSEEVKSSKTFFYPKQILYGKLAPYLDKCVLVDFEGICSTDIIVFDSIDEEACPEFMVYQLHTDQLIDFATTTISGVTHPRTSWKSLKDFVFPLPPLPEQRRIAAVLNTIQDEIAAQDDLINALREFKRSVMARLFTYGAGTVPAETKMTEVGAIPVGWNVCSISEVSKISGGGTPSTRVPEYWGDEIAWLTPSDVTSHQGVYIDHSNRSITREGLANSSAKLMPPGTVLMTSRATIGEAVICAVPMATNQGFINMSVDANKLLNEYLLYWITWNKEYIKELGTGSTFTEVAKGVFKTVAIPLPPLVEQRAISNNFNAIQDKIAAEEDRKSALQEFFRSMLKQLMTGQIRLLSDEGLPL